MRRALAIAAVAGGVLAAAWILWPKAPDDDEALIRAAIGDIAAKASEKDIGGLAEHVSDRYQGEGGSKTELKRYLLGYTMRSDWVAALPAKVEVGSIEGQKAKVTLVVLLARRPAQAAEELRAEEIAGTHQIEADLEKEEGVWRVVNARRRNANAGDFL